MHHLSWRDAELGVHIATSLSTENPVSEETITHFWVWINSASCHQTVSQTIETGTIISTGKIIKFTCWWLTFCAHLLSETKPSYRVDSCRALWPSCGAFQTRMEIIRCLHISNMRQKRSQPQYVVACKLCGICILVRDFFICDHVWSCGVSNCGLLIDCKHLSGNCLFYKCFKHFLYLLTRTSFDFRLLSEVLHKAHMLCI